MSYHDIFTLIIYIIIILFAAAEGAFLNLCIERLPKEQPLFCKNRNGNRKENFSIRHIAVIILNVLCHIFVAWQVNVMTNPARFIFTALLFSALIIVFFTDLKYRLISNYVVIFIALLSIPNYIFCHGAMGTTLKSHIIGLFAVSLPLLLIERLSKGKAMGRGDVYLMAAGGLFLGVQNILVAFIIGLIGGLIAGIIVRCKTKSSVFPLGPWLSVGIAVSSLYSCRLAEWYLTITGLERFFA